MPPKTQQLFTIENIFGKSRKIKNDLFFVHGALKA